MACTSCPVNHECPLGQTIAPCPLFFYSNDGESYCQPCPDGKDCRESRQPNTSSGAAWSTALTETYAESVAAIIAPVSCVGGFYSRALDFMCVPCPRGHSCAAGAAEPVQCLGGQYADEGQETCSTCPTEYYSKAGSAYCTPVPPGFRIKDDGLTTEDIEVCPHKTYSEWGEETCETCEAGFLCPQKTGEPAPWHFSCPRGSYCTGGVQTKCPAGYAGIRERASSQANGCIQCPAGFYCPEGTADFLKSPCPRGAYCAKGAAMVVCPQGTYNDNLMGRSVADCQQCPNGHECAEGTVDRGDVCKAGNYCPKGSYPDQFACPAGTYGADRTGKSDISECLPCPPGHYCPEGSGSATPAPAGKWTPLSGMPSEGALYKCPPKFHCPNQGMTNYLGFPCAAGHYCPAGTATATQFPCPEGTFSDRADLHDKLHCDVCPKGFHCAAGTTTKNSQIIECPQNKYCPPGTMTSAIPLCPAGYYAPHTRSMSLEDCFKCRPGSYCLEGASPVTCDAGFYCPAGTKTATEFPCPGGYYNDQTGQHSVMACKQCGINNKCPDYAITGTPVIAPTQCTDGFYNDASTTATVCQSCPAGYFCVQALTNPSQSPHP